MRNFRLFSLLLLMIGFIASNCTKEGPEGPVGATGPQGPSGSNGTGGTQGPQGPSGPAGTANVVYSAWYTTVTGDYTTTGVEPYAATLLFDKAATGVTQTVIDNGVVLCYMKDFTSGTLLTTRSTDVVQLPYVSDLVNVEFYDFTLNAPGNIRFLYKALTPLSALQVTGTSYRYVIIPGGVLGGKPVNGYAKSSDAAALKNLSYADVCRKFNIPAEGTNIP